LKEKNHQVSLVKDIYSTAEVVLCWMGLHDDSLIQTMHWISIVAQERAELCADDILDPKTKAEFFNIRQSFTMQDKEWLGRC